LIEFSGIGDFISIVPLTLSIPPPLTKLIHEIKSFKMNSRETGSKEAITFP
jgi:hypothetical protein